MKIISRLKDRRFCAFCKSQRRIFLKKHVDLTNVLGTILVSLGLTWGFWGSADPRGVLIFCILILAAEVFIYVRWRQNIVCRSCGFDPLVYKRSPSAAAKQVRQHYEERSKRPEFLLSASPLVNVYRQLQEQERSRQKVKWLAQRQSPATSLPPPGAL